MSILRVASLFTTLISLVAGHGYIKEIDIDGQSYTGYLVNDNGGGSKIGWSTSATNDGYVTTGYSSPDIICHMDGKPAASAAPVKAGGTVKLQWTSWPSDHHGPVITYLAKSDTDDWSSLDKTSLKFFKFDQGGLISGNTATGTWATDQLIAAGSSRTVTIPSSIEPGNYVLRQEIIALHSAGNPQNYPQCINLKVTGGGSASPSGTAGESLYKASDPGLTIDIWHEATSYDIPGPALYTGGDSSDESNSNSESTTTSTTTTTATSTTTMVTSQTDDVVSGSSDGTSTTTAPASTSTAGVMSGACSQNFYWYCNGGTSYQRCVNNVWSESQNLAQGTECKAGISENLSITATRSSRNMQARQF
ncbi:hypothetical protein N7462_007300 [Penicillium macrosclerotiorum]|uniref:uncharacterized protein n=1 Tax=Penicillium macrosclerotiorum TaxID=303699 RepID=UPI0025489CEB|nr:uncharacterized protein N7462_007300 [Penicillium macrosclerotiorum]KAJ5679056.1 hypothetical protein N7462_007300 [Penicillium macrosclerotiorum]